MWSAAGWGPVPGANGAATFKPRRRIRPGPEVLGAGGREAAACRRRRRAHALSRAGAGLGRNQPGPDGPGALGVGRGAAEAAPGGGGFVYPGEEVSRSGGGRGTRADRGGGLPGGGGRHRDSPPSPQPGEEPPLGLCPRLLPSRPGRCPSPAAVPAAAVVSLLPLFPGTHLH